MKFQSIKRKLEAEIRRLRHKNEKEARLKKERTEIEKLRRLRDSLRRSLSNKKR